MGGGYGNLAELGAFVIWIFKGGRGKVKDYKSPKSFLLAFLIIVLIVLLLRRRIF